MWVILIKPGINTGTIKIVVVTLAITSIIAFAILLQPVLAQSSLEGIAEFYAADLGEGQLTFMWLGEGVGEWAGTASAGVMIKTSKHAIIIDPADVLPSDAINALKSLDLILITHEHSDHFNADSTVVIHERTGAPVMVSAGVYPFLQERIANDKLVEMLPNEVETVKEIKVTAIPAVHPADRPVMYLINVDGLTIFHGSDSGFAGELNDIGSEVHLAFVPAGAPSPTASPEVAASMVRALKPYVTVPVHGMFEEMKTLEDMVSDETVTVIPAAYVVKVPSQIVPEFPVNLMVITAVGLIGVLIALRSKSDSFLR